MNYKNYFKLLELGMIQEVLASSVWFITVIVTMQQLEGIFSKIGFSLLMVFLSVFTSLFSRHGVKSKAFIALDSAKVISQEIPIESLEKECMNLENLVGLSAAFPVLLATLCAFNFIPDLVLAVFLSVAMVVSYMVLIRQHIDVSLFKDKGNFLDVEIRVQVILSLINFFLAYFAVYLIFV